VVTSPAARACLSGPRAAALSLGVGVPDTWPPEELREALDFYARGLDRGDAAAGWGVWLVVHRAPDPRLAGSAGFKGRPDRGGCVELGYGIEPEFRRRGLATEATEALVRWAWARGAGRIVAECHEDNEASRRVLRRIGMRPFERRQRMQWWELSPPC
jgi:ribosomal-protein-alanine N-acetyltransferase